MSNKEFIYRFAVGNHNGLRSSMWRIWTSKVPKSDIYIAARNLGGTIKISLHESGEWRTAFTYEYAKRIFDNPVQVSDARLIEAWTRPNDIAPGLTLAFRIIIPSNDLEDIPIDEKSKDKIVLIPPPEKEDLTEIVILLTKPSVETSNWPGKNGMGTKFLARYTLANGETLWLVYMYTKASPEWFLDKKKNRQLLSSSRPAIANYWRLLKSTGPRILFISVSEK